MAEGGAAAQQRADLDREVRGTVEPTLADIKTRGDAAVRELSDTFHRWDRDD